MRVDEKGQLQPLARDPQASEDAQVFYLRRDLPELLADPATWRQARRTVFLSSFDELHVGYRNRTCLTDYAGELLICPSQNGMFRPLLVDAGRVVAVIPAGQNTPEFHPSVRRSARLDTDIARALRRTERRR